VGSNPALPAFQISSREAQVYPMLAPNMGCNLRDLANSEDTTVEAMRGKRVGIDSFLLAFQFLTTIRDRSPTGDGGPLKSDNGKVVAHLMGFLSRASLMLSKGVKPVFIFDGTHPELKRDEMDARRARRELAETEWKAALERGDFATAQKMAQRCVKYTPEMVEESMEMLSLMGIPAFRAKAEGEAQAAVMAANGQLDAVATQDWDALLYGAPVVIRNLTSDGSKRMGRVIRAQRIELSQILSENELTRDQLIDLAIMIGTDFHPGIKGIGPKTGLKLIKEFGTIEAICAAKEKEIPDRIDEIREVFRNHPVVEIDDEALKQGDVDVEGLKKFLVDDRQFSQKRFDNAMELLETAGLVRTGGQTSLFSF
jgi:flap endonuclease-1